MSIGCSLELKEKISHGTLTLPAAVYPLRAEQAGCFVPYHWHNEFELAFVHSGEFLLETDFAAVPMREGDISFLPPAHLHMAILEEGKHCRVSFFVFHPELLASTRGTEEPIAALCSGSILPQLRFTHADPIYPKLRETVETLSRLMTERPPYFELGVRTACLTQCFSVLDAGAYTQHRTPSAGKAGSRERFKTAAAYIEEHFSSPITLQALADAVGLSRQHFCRFFRETSGMSPMEYVNFRRIDAAAKALLETDDAVTEIAGRCGFETLSYFNRQFRRQKGCTPSAYRTKNRP